MSWTRRCRCYVTSGGPIRGEGVIGVVGAAVAIVFHVVERGAGVIEEERAGGAAIALVVAHDVGGVDPAECAVRLDGEGGDVDAVAGGCEEVLPLTAMLVTSSAKGEPMTGVSFPLGAAAKAWIWLVLLLSGLLEM